MKESKLKLLFKHLSFIELTDDWILFDTLELYNLKSELSVQFDSITDALNYELEGKSISAMLDNIKFEFVYNGGRGAGISGEMGGGFNDQKTDSRTVSLFPATFNRQGRYTTQEAAIAQFEKMYGGAKREYGISVDPNGFVYTHRKGQKGAIQINAHSKGHMVVHNHPEGGWTNFSKADLVSTTHDKNASGIIATTTRGGKTTRHTLVKGSHFKSAEFMKGVNTAKWPKKYNYDQGVKWWLKRNAKKYGYTYTVTGM